MGKRHRKGSKGIECGEQAECKALPDGPGRHSGSTIEPFLDTGWDWGGAGCGAVSRGQGSPGAARLAALCEFFWTLGQGTLRGVLWAGRQKGQTSSRGCSKRLCWAERRTPHPSQGLLAQAPSLLPGLGTGS